jgi:hypothetical protein
MEELIVSGLGAGVLGHALLVDLVKYPAFGYIVGSPIGKASHLTVQANVLLLLWHVARGADAAGQLAWGLQRSSWLMHVCCASNAFFGGLSMFTTSAYFALLHFDPTNRFFARQAIKDGRLRSRFSTTPLAEGDYWCDQVWVHLPQLPLAVLSIFTREAALMCDLQPSAVAVAAEAVVFGAWYVSVTLAVWRMTSMQKDGIWPYPFMYMFRTIGQHVMFYCGMISYAMSLGFLQLWLLSWRCGVPAA